jgi:hypothetical protein
MHNNLLVRPAIQSDEWWQGYVSRALYANGISARGTSNATELAAVIGHLDRRHHLAEKSVAGGAILSGHHVGWGGILNHRAPGPLCVLCWRESAHIRLCWRLTGIKYCQRHGCELTSHCPKCGNRVRLHNAYRMRCHCGANMLAYEPRSWVGREASTLPAEVVGCPKASSPEIAARLLYLHLNATPYAEIPCEGESAITHKGALHKCELGSESWMAAVTRLLRRLREPTKLSNALYALLQFSPRWSQGSMSIMEQLPLWEWASELIDRGANPYSAVLDSLIDTSALEPKRSSPSRSALAGGCYRFAVTGPGSACIGDYVSFETQNIDPESVTVLRWRAHCSRNSPSCNANCRFQRPS